MISLSTSIVPLPLSSLSYGPFPAVFRSGEIQTGKLRFRSQTAACVVAPRRRQDRYISLLQCRALRSVSFVIRR